MLKPIKVIFYNFLSFYGRHEVNFPEAGVHYIYGENHDSFDPSDIDDSIESHSVGSGKSSYTFVLQYAFFGSISKDISKDKIINKIAKKDLEVTLYFNVDEKEYKIERYRKHHTFGNSVFLSEKLDNSETWVNITKSKSETQTQIQNLINSSFTLYSKSILFSREDNKQFLSLTTGKRTSIINSIINMQQIEKYIKHLRQNRKILKDNDKFLNDKIIELTTIIEKEKEHILDMKENYENKKLRYNNKIKSLSNSSQLLGDMTLESFEEAKNKNNQIKKEIDSFKEIIQNNKNEIKEIELIKEKHDNDIEKYKKDLEKYNYDLDNLEAVECPECNYKIINVATKDYIVEKIKNVISKIAENGKLLPELIKKIDSLGIKETKILHADFQIKELKKSIKEIPKLSFDELKEIKEFEQQKKSYEHSLVENEKDRSVIKNKIIDLKKEKEKFKELRITYDKNKRSLNIAEEWLELLDVKQEHSIKQFVVSKIIPVFNMLLNEILNIVYKGDMVVTFDNFFEETILFQNKDWDYQELSTGEKTKLNLCVNLTIFELIKINLAGSSVLFLDEIFSNIDKNSILIFVDLIKERYAKQSAVFIISHRQGIVDLLNPKTITRIDKINEKSLITEVL